MEEFDAAKRVGTNRDECGRGTFRVRNAHSDRFSENVGNGFLEP